MAVNPSEPDKVVDQGFHSTLGKGYYRYKTTQDLHLPTGEFLLWLVMARDRAAECGFDTWS